MCVCVCVELSNQNPDRSDSNEHISRARCAYSSLKERKRKKEKRKKRKKVKAFFFPFSFNQMIFCEHSLCFKISPESFFGSFLPFFCLFFVCFCFCYLCNERKDRVVRKRTHLSPPINLKGLGVAGISVKKRRQKGGLWAQGPVKRPCGRKGGGGGGGCGPRDQWRDRVDGVPDERSDVAAQWLEPFVARLHCTFCSFGSRYHGGKYSKHVAPTA